MDEGTYERRWYQKKNTKQNNLDLEFSQLKMNLNL